MSEIRQWLTDLGLDRYADAFEDNEIDPALLPELDHDVLKDIGVTVAGHRLKILSAAKRFGAEPLTQATQTDDTAPARSAAERRQLTVMFCDLVGSTALSEQLDPEDLRTVMAAYRKAARDVVARFDGHVAQYLGDGVMAYFGWPRAHEDDAERAVCAGLAIVADVKSVAAPEPLQVRVGIATGEVVVGEGADDDAQANKLAVGDTPNLAARLQGLADADQVIIGPVTHRLIHGQFEHADMGERELKGLLEPVNAWRVTGDSTAEGRFEARAVGGMTPLVGREEELGLLLRRWAQAKDGEGQVVLLSGEPGIGKSRLIRALRDHVANEPHTRLRYQCLPYHTNSALFPMIDQLTRAAGFESDDTPDLKLDKLESLLQQSTDDVAGVAPLIAAMMSLPQDRYPQLDLSPQRLKDETIAALTNQLPGLSEDRPVLMLFEDAHWCDPTTMEVLGSIIDRLQDLRVLLLITYRPEFEPPWTGHAHVSAHSLNRLSRRQGADLVAKVTGGKRLPDEVLEQIVAKTDGVPLFVEELTKTVLEADFLTDTGDVYMLDGPLPPLAIPTTLKDSLMARLDRLAQVKEVAQIGACIGREFAYPLLAAVSPLSDNQLRDSLQQLIDSELIFRRGSPPEATYTFKHALVQDVAHESLLNSTRQQIHQRIAMMIEQKFPALATDDASVLAHHYTHAGLVKQALPFWLAAGRQARDRMAYPEAVGHLSEGLRLIANLPDGTDRDRTELEFLLAIGPVQTGIKGPGSNERDSIYSRTEELCRHTGDDQQRTNSICGIVEVRSHRGHVEEVFDRAKQLLAMANATNDPTDQLRGYDLFSWCEMFRGRWATALENANHAISHYEHRKHRDLVFETGRGSGVMSHNTKAYCAWFLGFPVQSLNAAVEAISIAEQAAHPQDLVFVLWASGADLHHFAGEVGLVLEYANRVRILGTELRNEHAVANAAFFTGWAVSRFGEVDAGIEQMQAGLDALRASGTVALNGRFAADLGEAYGMAGQPQKGLDVIAEAQVIRPTVFADISRIQGDLLRQVGDDAVAEKAYLKAIEIARNEEIKSFELRAATPLARLWHDHGKVEDAYNLLFPVYDWFTEGFDTPDLIAAKALLDELASH